MLAEFSVRWGNLELICIGLHVSLPSWFRSWGGLKETGAKADASETKGIAEAEANTGEVAVAVCRSVL